MPEWLTFLLADTSALQLVFWFIAIGALIAVIVKLWPALTQLVTIVNSVTGLPSFIARTDETLLDQDVKIAAIHHEVHYNNGTSVKDSQARTERVITEEIMPALKTLADADVQLRADIEDTQSPKETP